VGEPKEKRPLGKARRRRDDNIKMDLLEMRCEHMDCFDMDQDMERWLALVNNVMDFRVQKMGEMSVLLESRLDSQNDSASCSKYVSM